MDTNEHGRGASFTRRKFLTLAGAGVGAGILTACGTSTATTALIRPTDAVIARLEARRRRAGAPVRDITLTAAPTTIDLAGRQVETWAFNNQVPGPVVRANVGDVLRVAFRNELPEQTSIHWHGIALRSDMDGVPGLTQRHITPGAGFLYEFALPDPGTYWFHPHIGTQLDRGLYAPLIVDEPGDAGSYDDEWIVVLDDWTDGVGPSPDTILQNLTSRRSKKAAHSADSMGSTDSSAAMGMSAGTSKLLGGDAGDVRYPMYLINGRPATDPQSFTSTPGRRVRLRLINAASDTAFRVALGGHVMRVTHTDGFPVEPVETDAVLIGMGERIDTVVTLGDGAFPLVAIAEGKGAQAFAIVHTGTGDAGGPSVRPVELDRRVLMATALNALPKVALDRRAPDRTLRAILGGDMMRYRWTINGRVSADAEPLDVRTGERVRIEFVNQSMMFHPMHLHGHTFGLTRPAGAGARKDTVMVLPGERRAIEFDANNPGQWALHCHNTYHAEAGMITTLSYRR